VSRDVFADRVRWWPCNYERHLRELHNSHPESQNGLEDWRRARNSGGEHHPADRANLFSLKYLLMYFVVVAVRVLPSSRFSAAKRRLFKASIKSLRRNEFLASLSIKISRYLAPQVYKCIFSGEKDVTIHTERKKLTIFFSDIKDFAATTSGYSPSRLHNCSTNISRRCPISRLPGGTIDKFIGDAILIFFGDPETKGEAEDAKACVRMAFDMQRRLAELNSKWRNDGVENPFRVRMASTRVLQCWKFWQRGPHGLYDHWSRSQFGRAAAVNREPGHIVVSYETYALARDILVAQALSPFT